MEIIGVALNCRTRLLLKNSFTREQKLVSIMVLGLERKLFLKSEFLRDIA